MSIEGILYVEIINAPAELSIHNRVNNASIALKRELEPESRTFDASGFLETDAQKRVCELEEILESLVHWHDAGSIDESWWDGARKALATE